MRDRAVTSSLKYVLGQVEMKNNKKMFFLTETLLAVMVIAVAFIMVRERNGKEQDKISVIIQDSEDTQWAESGQLLLVLGCGNPSGPPLLPGKNREKGHYDIRGGFAEGHCRRSRNGCG